MIFIQALLDAIQQLPLWQFAKDNAEFCGLLLAVAAGIWGLATGRIAAIQNWLRQRSQKPLPFDTFPFEVVGPCSKKVVQQLSGSSQAEDDPLADFNIPYQTHRSDYNIQNELEKRLQAKRWLLIEGRTGLGKTREAAELADRLNQEGWTVLKLKNHEWLETPVWFPADRLGQQPKLLFFLDNLNQAMVSGRKLPVFDPEKLAQLSRAPLQERLLETLKFYESVCSPESVRVIATARNETECEREGDKSQLERLEFSKYEDFWDRFERYSLPEPDEQGVVNVLESCTTEANIPAEAQQFQQIALRNDRTFRNVVENLVRLKNRGQTLNLETFIDTLKGTWAERYQIAVKRPAARYIYDAIDLLQQVDVELHDFIVLATAQLLVEGNRFQKPWHRWQLSRTLKDLTATDRILQPRDGQIAGKEKVVDVCKYLPHLTQLLLHLADRYPVQMYVSLLSFASKTCKIERYEESLAGCDKLLQLDPTSAILWYCKGAILSALGRNEEAIAAYDQAIHYKPDDYSLWYRKGSALRALGRNENAIVAFDQAISCKPDDYESWFFKGIALQDLGQKEDAVNAFNQVIFLKPDDYEAWFLKGLVLSDSGRKENAIAAFDQVIHLKSDFHKAWTFKGTALSNLEQKEAAIAAFDRAIQLKPDDHQAWYHKGSVLLVLGRKEDAINAFDQAIRLKPDDHQAWYGKGVALSILEQEEAAIAAYDRAIHFKPDDHEAWYHKGLALFVLGQNENVINAFDQALYFKSNYPLAWYIKARCFALQGDLIEAIDSLSRAIELDSECREIAKTDAKFDSIRGEDWFQTVVEGDDP